MMGGSFIIPTMHHAIEVKYCNNKSVFVINSHGLLKVLYTPFRVMAIEDVEGIPAQANVYVEAVYSDAKSVLHYLINDKLYSYKSFHIYINF
jgi:hypothetical protein